MSTEQSTINQSSSFNPSSSRNNGQQLERDNNNNNQHQNNRNTIIDCQEPTRLPPDYQPRDIDILCGQGKGRYEHVGNQKYKEEILKHRDRYVNAKTKTDKSQVIKFIVTTLRENGTYFVKKEVNCWYDIGNKKAREKTSHSIRDHLTRMKQRRENTNSKIAIRTIDNTMINPFQWNGTVYIQPAPPERQTCDTPDL